MKCPKCSHCWTRPKKAPKVQLPYGETGPGEVFPQRCWSCASPVVPGDAVKAHKYMPVVLCEACKDQARKNEWTPAIVAVA